MFSGSSDAGSSYEMEKETPCGERGEAVHGESMQVSSPHPAQKKSQGMGLK